MSGTGIPSQSVVRRAPTFCPAAIFSWLYAFGVVNPSNQVVAMIGRTLYQLTEPLLRPIRRYVPVFGGLDVSPIILLLILFLVERVILLYVYPYVF